MGYSHALAAGLIMAGGLAACAGQTPRPGDGDMDCAAISSEAAANDAKLYELRRHAIGMPGPGNAIAGLGFLVFLPLLYAVDFDGMASRQEIADRQQSLKAMAKERRCSEPAPANAVPPSIPTPRT